MYESESISEVHVYGLSRSILTYLNVKKYVGTLFRLSDEYKRVLFHSLFTDSSCNAFVFIITISAEYLNVACFEFICRY